MYGGTITSTSSKVQSTIGIHGQGEIKIVGGKISNFKTECRNYGYNLQPNVSATIGNVTFENNDQRY